MAMAESLLTPLEHSVVIVNSDGTPTPYLIQWLQQLRAEKAITDELAATAVPEDRLINTVNGILGGGNLGADLTLSADVQAILNQITTTRGSLLYRGAALWSALTPGAAGKFLKTLGAGADPVWDVPAAGGSASWVLGKKWDFAIDGAVATIDYVLPAGAADIYVIARAVTRANSGLDALRFSTDGGANYYAGASDYEWDNGSGANNAAAYAQTYNTTNAGTTARYWQVGWVGLNVNGAPKATHTYVLANGLARYRFVGSLAPVNAVRVLNASAGGNLTGGQVYILYR